MEDQKQKPVSKMDEIRKDFPKAGMRWTEEESNLLNAEYKKCLEENYDFENFLNSMAQRFQRRPNGIRGRLALSFPNIPGWDYEAVKQRDEEYKRQKEEKVNKIANPQTDKLLLSEYEKYSEFRNETFKQFTARLAKSLDVTKNVIVLRLRALIKNLIEYLAEDLEGHKSAKAHEEELESEEIDISSNPEMLASFKLMEETRENIFLTGEAGTGKSTLLKYFKQGKKKKK
jgi:ATPase subunit of ABC transporter with duplicated ATPase domains